jgi:plasmid stabilization system protein ParE
MTHFGITTSKSISATRWGMKASDARTPDFSGSRPRPQPSDALSDDGVDSALGAIRESGPSDVSRIQSHSESGDSAPFESSELAGLRYRAVNGFPHHLIWYSIDGSQIQVVRLLHSSQDAEHELTN